jgi:2-iminobutanoate/2-iminopropanoate deaminase
MIEKVFSNKAPKPIGPYSQAVKAGGFVFASAQLGIDPATGSLAQGVEEQARLAIRNVGSVLEAAGAGWASVVKVSLYLTDMSDFGKVNEIYLAFLGGAAPARATIGVSSLPKEGLVALDALAYLG